MSHHILLGRRIYLPGQRLVLFPSLPQRAVEVNREAGALVCVSYVLSHVGGVEHISPQPFDVELNPRHKSRERLQQSKILIFSSWLSTFDSQYFCNIFYISTC